MRVASAGLLRQQRDAARDQAEQARRAVQAAEAALRIASASRRASCRCGVMKFGGGMVIFPDIKSAPFVCACGLAGSISISIGIGIEKKVPKYDKSDFAISGDGDLGQTTLFPSGWRWLSLSIYAHRCYRVKLSSRYCTHVCDFRASDINKTNERINNHAWHSCTSFFMSFSSLFILWHSLVLRRFNI